MNNVKIVWATPDLDEHLAYIARVSNPDNQDNPKIEGLLKYMMREGHVSPFTMCNACLEFNTPRDIARQALRHSSMPPQEFCIAGDSKITTVTKQGRTKKIAIESLYKRFNNSQYCGMSDNLVRVFDESSKLLTVAKIKEVFSTGKKVVYTLTLENGKKIKATEDHKFLTFNGFKRLADITVGDFVGCNGVKVWQDKEWLEKAKAESLSFDGVTYIANKAGVSYHTIRKWLKIYGLQYTKQEVATYTQIWNKGLDKEQQPRFGKTCSDETRLKMRKSAKKGEESNLYINGNKSHDTVLFNDYARQFSYSFKLRLLREQNYKCAVTGVDLTEDNCEIDHKEPVYSRPDLALDYKNLQAVHKDAHRLKTTKESVASRYTARYSKVKSIVLHGEVETYDMEIEHYSHNYVANGIITHNSQRYQDVSKLGDFCLREFRLQDETNRQSSIEVDENNQLALEWKKRQESLLEVVREHYEWCIKNGGAKEVARVILPEGLTPSRLYFNGNMRSWIFYLKSRLHESTQKEHRELAKMVLTELRKVAPITMSAFFPENEDNKSGH